MAAPTFTTPTTSFGYKDATNGRFPEYVDPELFNEMAENNPFIAMAQQIGGGDREVDQLQVYFQQDMLPPKVDAINNVAGYSDSAVTWIVGHAEYFCVGDVVHNVRTDEKNTVASTSGSSLGGANTITVNTRPGLGTTAYALLNNDELRIMNRAYGDKESGDQVSVLSQPGRDFNYLQDMELSAPISTKAANRKYHQKMTERERLQDENLKLWARMWDMQLMIGTAYKDTTGSSGDKYYMGGLKHYLPTANIFTAKPSGASGAQEFNLSENNLNLALAQTLQGKGNKRKFALCGYKAWIYFMSLKAINLQQQQDDEIRNLTINRYRGGADLKLVNHFQLTGNMASWVFIIDPDYIHPLYFKGERPRLYTNCQLPTDIRRILDIYQGTVSAEFAVPQVHMLIKGVEIA